MSRSHFPCILLLLCSAFLSCNQPFEPAGPVNNKLALYGFLGTQTDTQYVRVATTFGTPPGAEVRDAVVQLVCEGQTIRFRDTTVQWVGSDGAITPTNVYVAYNVRVKDGAQYELHVQTPSGLSASAITTALSQPSFAMHAGRTPRYFTLDAHFGTESGACVTHFYFDYYALVDGGWEYHREEVPTGSTIDGSGNEMPVYPKLSLVEQLVLNRSLVTMQFDSTYYEQARSRIYDKYPASPVVYVQIEFVLTQIDDALYSYYYLNNGPTDQTTIRLDQLDYTNIKNGYGVFGSRAEVAVRFPILN